jgi:hypothetical protein
MLEEAAANDSLLRQLAHIAAGVTRNLRTHRWEYKQSLQYAGQWVWRRLGRYARPGHAGVTI